MELNRLQLFIGPSVPDQVDAVQLAFVAAPNLTPDVSIASLSADRYVNENYMHRRTYHIPLREAQGTQGWLTATFGGTDFLGLHPELVSQTAEAVQGTFSLSERNPTFSFSVLNSPILVPGIQESRSGNWYPVVKAGTVWRKTTIKQGEIDETLPPNDPMQPSWLIRSGLREGDEVFLIYTVPETAYGSRSTSSSNRFPGPGVPVRVSRELADIVAPNRVALQGEPISILRIEVNGLQRFPTGSETYDGSEPHPYIAAMDAEERSLVLRDRIDPDDQVLIEYATPADRYVYTGYRDFQNRWFAYDANPEYGHFIDDPELGHPRLSTDALSRQTVIYLIPSAYMLVRMLGQNTVSLTFESAFNWGESHFVRHLVGQPAEIITNRNQDGPVNTWGYAVFGRNYYDEAVGYEDDVFSSKAPSIMPLATVLLSAPAAVGSAANADIRVRGGGVPETFPMVAVNTQADGLDTLRGYWDLGVYEGGVVRAGGVAEIHIDKSVLDNFSLEEIEQIVRSRMLPGVDYEIKYV